MPPVSCSEYRAIYLLNLVGLIVRRPSFWDNLRLKIRESLARLGCDVMRLADGAARDGWRLSVV
jgi:hypothetical protein